ncbi:MAG: VOC family protein [Chloroflexi bacterium]|nr:VOC family protein [Chloroflexota bacterium]
MITDFHHASFTVRDLKESLKFYVDMLGGEHMFDRDLVKGYVAKIVGYPELHQLQSWVRLGGEKLELIQYVSPQGTPIDAESYNAGTAHLAFEVDNVHELCQKLRANGYRTRSSEPVRMEYGPHEGGYAFYVYDPDDISIELMQLPQKQ